MKRIGNAGMIAGTLVAALGFYTLSLRVSAERSGVERLQHQVVADLRDVRGLEAELRTRARLPVLQRWNDNVLGLGAPLPKQFAADAFELAAYAPGAPMPAVAPVAQVQFAVARDDAPVVVPAAVAVPLRGLTKASYEVPEISASILRQAQDSAPADLAKPSAPKTVSAEPGEARAKDARVTVTPVKTKAKADPLGGLLDSIDTAAAAERSGFRKVAMR